MKEIICIAAGGIGAAVAALFGGWSPAMTTLLICMTIDYITGLVVAALFNNSPKSKKGGLESGAGFKGLAKKIACLAMVAVCYRVDVALGTRYFLDAAVLGFTANEVLSITENLGLMGVPLPNAIKKMIDVLHEKEEKQ